MVGYSKNTVRLIKAALSSVLSDAVDDGYITTNPAFSAGRKRGRKGEVITQAERLQKIRPFSWEDRDALLAACALDRRHHALLATLAKAGLRPGEGMALKPEDLDFKAMTATVERAVTDGGRVKDCQTHEVRTIDLTPDLAATLKKHLTWLKAEALRVGANNREWMFPRRDGSLMDKDYLGAVLRRALKRAGLPHHRVYDLRHTYASLLLADGAPITYVSAQLGHSSPATTMRHYARWMPSKGRRWVDLLDRKAGSRNQAFVEPESGTSAEEG
jgi:integrase